MSVERGKRMPGERLKAHNPDCDCGASLLAEETAGKIRGILAEYAAVWQRLLAVHRAEEATAKN